MAGKQPEGSGLRLGEALTEQSQMSLNPNPTLNTGEVEADAKAGKRRFWVLGKKKEDEKAKKQKDSTQANFSTSSAPKLSPMRPASPLKGFGSVSALTKTTSHPYSPSSPAHNLQSPSPAPPSPASSQIFERNVQEDSLAIREQAPIPGHITTENHIPPVLDASSEAITNNELSPDQVEIVMHSAHQPASVTVTGTELGEIGGPSPMDESLAVPDNDEGASNYGSLDSTDVRRLSFISFADVVHAEHTQESGSFSTGMISPVISHNNRSPSPIRSPFSSHGPTGSPTMSGSVSSAGLETSPSREGRTLGTPMTGGHSPSSGGELTIETMRQALRKTGSGDLSSAKSAPLSAISGTEASTDHQAQ